MSNWSAGHTPYHYPTPLQSPAPRTPYYPSAQWPPASTGPPTGPPCTVSLESRRSYGTALSYVPSRPYLPTPPPAENGVNYVEQVYSPSIAASLGSSNCYGSRSTYDRTPTPEDEIFIPPSLTPSERKAYEDHKRAPDHARARGIPPSSYALGALTPYQRSQYDLDPPAYHSTNPSSMLPTLPSPVPSDSGVMVYVGSNGGLALDVTITTGPYETVVQIKHHLHREERRGDRRHRS